MGGAIHDIPPTKDQTEQRLDSWKAIAAYLKRDITTCQRWEKKEGMPVHRHVHDSKGSIYAFRSELDAWVQSRNLSASPAPADTALQGEQIKTNDASVGLLAARAKSWPGLPARWSRFAVVVPATLVFVFAAAVAGFFLVSGRYGTQPRQQALLAVLPFENLGADSGARYFSDGITQEVVDALLRATQIRVAASSASFRLRNMDAPKAAKALAATHVLSGSVERVGDRLHVIAQLTDVQQNRTLWSQTFDRPMTQAPALQHDIAIQIADALDMRLSESALEEAEAIDPVSYDHFLRGRDFFLRRNPKSAVRELEAAVRGAPNFARGWSTLAAARYLYASSSPEAGGYSAMESAARTAARHALFLEPNNAEALGVLAVLTPRGHTMEADRLFERALRIEPNNTQLLNWYSSFLRGVGRNRDALDALQRAYALDRITLPIVFNLATALMEEGFTQRATEIANVGQQNIPDYQVRYYEGDIFNLHVDSFLLKRDWNGLANYLSEPAAGVPSEELAFYKLARETAVALSKHDSGRFGHLRSAWHNAGAHDHNESVRLLVALGDVDGALDVVESAVGAQQNRSLLDEGWIVLFDRDLAPLRRNPRFPGLLAKWGLFDYWRATNKWPDFCQEQDLPFDCKTEAEKVVRPSVLHTSVTHS